MIEKTRYVWRGREKERREITLSFFSFLIEERETC